MAFAADTSCGPLYWTLTDTEPAGTVWPAVGDEIVNVAFAGRGAAPVAGEGDATAEAAGEADTDGEGATEGEAAAAGEAAGFGAEVAVGAEVAGGAGADVGAAGAAEPHAAEASANTGAK